MLPLDVVAVVVSPVAVVVSPFVAVVVRPFAVVFVRPFAVVSDLEVSGRPASAVSIGTEALSFFSKT